MPDAYDFWADRLPAEDSAAIDAFWERFATEAADLAAAFDSQDGARVADLVPRVMAEALGPLDGRIFWEFGPGEAVEAETAHHLALSAELNHEERVTARALVRRAPPVADFAFVEARPPSHETGAVAELIAARAGARLTLTGASARPGEFLGVDIIGRGRGAERSLAGQAGLAFSVLCGEAVERDWLNECHGEPEAGGGLISRLFGGGGSEPEEPQDIWLARFEEEARGVIATLMDARPEGRFSDPIPDGEVSLFRIDPSERDWQDDPRADTITYQTARTDYYRARVAGSRIASVRFSRHDERFLGIQIDRTEAHPFDQVDDRGTLAETIDAALRAAGLGGVWGEGHGTAHVYIDIAVARIEDTIALLEPLLAREGITGPAHLLFDEAGLETRALPLTHGH